MIELVVNGKLRQFNDDPAMPLLWYLRDGLSLRGTKYGCGIGQCGACTVHVEGRAQRSCVTLMRSLKGRTVTTIEGVNASGNRLHAVQRAWIEQDVPQCGYCQVGQIMAAIDLLENNARPSDEQIDRGMTNICRCGTY